MGRPRKQKAGECPQGIAVIYARYSSHNQREKSAEQQVAECEKYAQKAKLTIVERYIDKARSGKNDKRPEYQRLMSDAHAGKFGVVIAYKSSRIGRDMLEALVFEAEMERIGVKICYVKEEFDNTASGRLSMRLMMSINQFHSENMAEDIRRNQHYNAEQCKANGAPPYGYKTDETQHFVIREDEAAVVREIFARIVAGERFKDVADDLNARGIKTRRGQKWGKSSFQNLVRNERYKGIYIFDDVRIEGGMPQIVTPELFERMQKRLDDGMQAQGKHDPGGDYLLTGKLFCGYCGAKMIGLCGTGKSGIRHYYYACADRRTGGGCRKESVRRDYIETEITRGIIRYCLTDAMCEQIADEAAEILENEKDAPELLQARAHLNEIETAIKNTLAALDIMGGKGVESLAEHLRDLEKDRAEAQKKIALLTPLDDEEITREDVLDFLHKFRRGDVCDKEFQRAVFENFLDKAFLFDDHVTLYLDFSGRAGRGGDSVELSLDEIAQVKPDGVLSRLLAFCIRSPKQSQANTVKILRRDRSVGYFLK